MISAVQISLAGDPARQQMIPMPVVPVAAPEPAPTAPLPSSQATQDQFNPQDDNSRGQQGGNTGNQGWGAEALQNLRGQVYQAQQLRQQAMSALASGDTTRAREVAQQAAQIANEIRNTTQVMVTSGLGYVEMVVSSTHTSALAGTTDNISGGSTSGGEASMSSLDFARSGLGSSKEAVDAASQIPHHTIEDRRTIDGARRQVLEAMAGVETIAANAYDTGQTTDQSAGVDIKA